MTVLRIVFPQVEIPTRHAIARCRSVNGDEAEAWIQFGDYPVLGGRNVIGDKPPCAPQASRRLNRDVHRFGLELPAKHAAAHYPILDLEHVILTGSRAEDHRADETIVADSIHQTELQ